MNYSPPQLKDVSALGPSTAAERIVAIDVLRGFALLGILLIDIRSFANIEAAYFNPLAAGPLGTEKGTSLILDVIRRCGTGKGTGKGDITDSLCHQTLCAIMQSCPALPEGRKGDITDS